MRTTLTSLALAASFSLVSAAFAEVRSYNHTVKFAPSTPPSIEVWAYEAIEFTIVGQSQELSALQLPPPLDPNIRYIQEPTQIITAEYLNQGMTGAVLAVVLPPTTSTLRIPGLTPGKYKIRLMYPKGEVFDEREVRVNPSATPLAVESIGENGPNAFRLSWFTTGPSPKATAAPYSGVPAGKRFGAWLPNFRAPKDTTALFHLTLPVSGHPVHFYTTNQDHRQTLISMGWQDQGRFVNVLRDNNGVCPAGSEPVYRVFRPTKPGQWDATHRYTSDVSAYQEWVRSGN
jgi:Repeat of unknown function (DUF5648)